MCLYFHKRVRDRNYTLEIRYEMFEKCLEKVDAHELEISETLAKTYRTEIGVTAR